ncbi:MAG: molybdopterin-dependent oxidoreductase, partial [Acidimicrobiia bacterium]|nr:molybdopterin-dependent oxidoreductase [Acidimicrobiia bacterium]
VGGVGTAAITDLVAAVRGHRGRVAVMCGTGVTMARHGVVAEWLRWVILILSGSVDRAGGMRANRGVINRLRPPRADRAASPSRPGPESRPELPRVIGQLPIVAMVDEIEAGRLRALVVAGGNPITAFPQPDRLRAALARLDVLAVIDVAENELTGLATHVLPATGQLERADLTLAELTAVRSGMQFTPAVVAPVGARRPTWWILASVAQRMGCEMLGGAAPDQLTDTDVLRGLLTHSPIPVDEVLAAGPRGIDVPHEYGWVHDELLPDGQWNVAPRVMLEQLPTWTPPAAALVLTPRRSMAWSNSVRYGPGDDGPRAHLNPDDALDAGVHDGEPIQLMSAHGTVLVTATVDDRVRTGTVSMTHGHPARSPGALVSSAVDVDPLTAMPLASGVPVTIAAAPGLG